MLHRSYMLLLLASCVCYGALVVASPVLEPRAVSKCKFKAKGYLASAQLIRDKQDLSPTGMSISLLPALASQTKVNFDDARREMEILCVQLEKRIIILQHYKTSYLRRIPGGFYHWNHIRHDLVFIVADLFA